MADEAVLAIDPGHSKVGIAVVRQDGQVLHRAVVSVEALVDELEAVKQRFEPRRVVIGGGTGSRRIEQIVLQTLKEISVYVMGEAYTSEEARRRYLQENPPRGWRRLIPSWLRTPERPYDDYVAIILAERYWLQRQVEESENG